MCTMIHVPWTVLSSRYKKYLLSSIYIDNICECHGVMEFEKRIRLLLQLVEEKFHESHKSVNP